MQYTIIIQFRTSDQSYFGTLDELDFRNQVETDLGAILKRANLGYCDGGQAGAGSMEIFLEDIPNLQPALRLVRKYLTDQEYIGFCKIVHREWRENFWTVNHPQGAQFDIMKWV